MLWFLLPKAQDRLVCLKFCICLQHLRIHLIDFVQSIYVTGEAVHPPFFLEQNCDQAMHNIFSSAMAPINVRTSTNLFRTEMWSSIFKWQGSSAPTIHLRTRMWSSITPHFLVSNGSYQRSCHPNIDEPCSTIRTGSCILWFFWRAFVWVGWRPNSVWNPSINLDIKLTDTDSNLDRLAGFKVSTDEKVESSISKWKTRVNKLVQNKNMLIHM